MAHYHPPGMPRHLDYPSALVSELLDASAGMYPDRAAVVDGERSLTHGELHAAAAAVSHDLGAHGVRPGDVVAVHLPNCLDFLVAYFGIVGAGAVAALVNPLQPREALSRQLDAVRACAVITHPAHVGAVQEVGLGRFRRVLIVRGTECAPAPEDEGALRTLVDDSVVGLLSDVLEHAPQDADRPPRTLEDLVHLAFTGGTTGTPKAVRVLHRNVVANITMIMAWRFASRLRRGPEGLLGLQPIETLPEPPMVPGREVTVNVAPLFHVHALISTLGFLMGGMTVVLVGRFRPAHFVETVQRWEATYITGSPPMFLALAAEAQRSGATMPSVRLAMSGAAPLTAEKADRIALAFPHARIGEGYGMTEATCQVTGSPVTPGSLTKIGTVGLPMPDMEVQLRESDGRTPVPDGQEGEIWLRGPLVTDGYQDAPEQTAAQFVDGWLRTGDIGMLDDDGFLTIRDRAKDMLIYKGYNVYPRELEGVLSGHPDVARAAVVGRPDPDAGDLPVAFVVPEEGRDLDTEALMNWVAERVTPYQKVRQVVVVDDLPTSSAGKILKNELRAMLEGRRG